MAKEKKKKKDIVVLDKADIEVIPTGALALDVALGVGGIPRRKNYRNIWTRKFR